MMKYILLIALFATSLLGASQDKKNMHLVDVWTSDSATRYSDIWGYTANGREYAIIGSNWGTHFIDITDTNNIQEISSFIGNANDVIWRDFKTYKHYAYGVADGDSNSLQIFDLQYLPDSVIKVTDDVALSSSCHNIYIDSNRLYLASNTSLANGGRALDIYSLANPSAPTLALDMTSTFFGGKRLHDIFVRDNIAYCSAGYGGLYIYDLNDLNNPILINSITTYPDQGYNHSSWVSDDDRTLVVADEVPAGLALKLFDISDITDIEFLSMFESHSEATPHNPFIIGDNIFISYYMEGIQVFNYSNIFNVQKIAFYDTYPDNTDFTNFGPYQGCWGIYPFFESKNIVGSDITYGLQIVRMADGLFSSVDENKNPNEVKIFPNPTKTQLTIQNSKDYSSITVTNTMGKLIHSYENAKAKNVVRINTSDFSSGIYYLTLKNNQTQQVQKLIIK